MKGDDVKIKINFTWNFFSIKARYLPTACSCRTVDFKMDFLVK